MGFDSDSLLERGQYGRPYYGTGEFLSELALDGRLGWDDYNQIVGDIRASSTWGSIPSADNRNFQSLFFTPDEVASLSSQSFGSNLLRGAILLGAADLATSIIVSTAQAAEAAEQNPDDVVGAATPYLQWGIEAVTALPSLLFAGIATEGDAWRTLALASLSMEYFSGLGTAVYQTATTGVAPAWSYDEYTEIYRLRAQELLQAQTRFVTTYSEPVTLPDGGSIQYITSVDANTGSLAYAGTITWSDEFDGNSGPNIEVTYGGALDSLISTSVSTMSFETTAESSSIQVSNQDGSSREVVLLNGDRAGSVLVIDRNENGQARRAE